MLNDDFPKTYFLDIADHDNLLGRLILTPIETEFMVEIDIVLKESQKIIRHVDILHSIPEMNEAIDLGVQCLAESVKRYNH